ncbi:hypothetical protein [Streptomyces sp. NPDC058869]|uniref:hypothetical protein n=1 Tax=Streptomyces sp. NPDC058869 TaxID=3346659 RepID=UPI00368242D1
MQLPEQPVAGQPDPTIQQNVNRLVAAVDDALLARQATSYRDDTQLPTIGPTPPVEQPGQRGMSQWAIDASGVLKGVSVASIPLGVGVWIVGQVDPWTLGIILGSPAVAALAVARLVAKVKDANQATQPVVQNYYGTVHHDTRTVTSTTRGVIANNRNQLPK